MDRRRFLHSAAASAALAALPSEVLAAAPAPARLIIDSAVPGPAIPPDFLGFSYETRQLIQPEFFSAENSSLAGFFRQLGTGVLRIGGNSSDTAFWTPGAAQPGSPSGAALGPDTGDNPTPPTRTTPQSIRSLRGFLNRTGWRAIYGFNLGQGTPRQAAEEAAFVFETLGDRLICFQIGNEPDLYSDNGMRPKTYSYAEFAQDWRRFHDAVKTRVPAARFAGPDTSGTAGWIQEFARDYGSQIMLLSTHYYAMGPASNPAMNIDRLLRPNPRWADAVPAIRRVMEQSRLPYRLTETNSCFGGGKAGVSNTQASALWALDLMLQVAALGGSGINFHAGGYGWYTPIAGSLENGFVARPEYYAMRMMAPLAGGRMMASRLDAAARPLLSGYAATAADGKLSVLAINKDARQDVALTVEAGTHARGVSVERLIAPRLADEQDTTLGGSPIGASGAWEATAIEHIPVQAGAVRCAIPAGSAARLCWEK